MRRLHDKKIDDAKYYENIWGKEPKTRKWKYDTVRMMALIRDVKKNDKVVDLGTGIYGSAQFLAEHRSELNCDIIALDQSYTAKEFVDKFNLPMKYVLGDVEKTGLKNEEFDVVMGGEIIEHLEEPENLAKEMDRICKKGGWMTISTVNTFCPQAIEHGDYPEHIWEFTPEDLVNMFKKYGETEYVEVGNYHFIYCKKI